MRWQVPLRVMRGGEARHEGKMREEEKGERHLTGDVCSCSSTRWEGVYLVASFVCNRKLRQSINGVGVDVCSAYLLIMKLCILILESNKQTNKQTNQVPRSIVITSQCHHLDIVLVLFCASSFCLLCLFHYLIRSRKWTMQVINK